MFYSREGFEPPRAGYLLEAGELRWEVGPNRFGFLARLEITEPTTVHVRQVNDCAVILDFLAAPGSIHIVRFNANGSARVERAGATEGGGLLAPHDRHCLPAARHCRGRVGTDPRCGDASRSTCILRGSRTPPLEAQDPDESTTEPRWEGGLTCSMDQTGY